MKTNKISKLSKYLIFSFIHIDVMTIIILILATINPEVDYSQFYTIFCGIYGAIETLGCAIIKCFNIKKEM